MAITLTKDTVQTNRVSVVSPEEAEHVVVALIGYADHIEENIMFIPDGEFRRMRATQLAAKLQAGFMVIEDTIGAEMTNFSPSDHSLIEAAISFMMRTEIDPEATSLLDSVGYLMAEGLKLINL